MTIKKIIPINREKLSSVDEYDKVDSSVKVIFKFSFSEFFKKRYPKTFSVKFSAFLISLEKS